MSKLRIDFSRKFARKLNKISHDYCTDLDLSLSLSLFRKIFCESISSLLAIRINKVHMSLNIRKNVHAIACPCVGDDEVKRMRVFLLFPFLIVAAPLFSPSHLVDAHVQVSIRRESTRVMYRQTRIEYALRSVYSRPTRFKNGRRAPRLPFFIPRLALFCFLIRLLTRSSFRYISFIFNDCGVQKVY